MNRHDRRRAARIERYNKFHREYLSELPELPVTAPCEPGRVYHLVYFYDEWCSIYSKDNGSLADCNCNPIIKRYEEPKRS